MSPNLRREIAYVKVGANDAVVKFKNGSTIEAVASSDSARGYRCNILILDECRLISQHVLNSIKWMSHHINIHRRCGWKEGKVGHNWINKISW